MFTFRPAASAPLLALLALSYFSLYIPGSHAQSQLPACATPCVASAIPTTACSVADTTCICDSNPFLIAFTACINQSCSSDDIQSTLTFYSVACAGGPGFTTIAASSSTTGSGTSPSTVVTFPSSGLPSTSATTTSRATTTGTPSTTSASTQTVSSSPTNAAASLSTHAHVVAALMAGGIGALVAVVV